MHCKRIEASKKDVRLDIFVRRLIDISDTPRDIIRLDTCTALVKPSFCHLLWEYVEDTRLSQIMPETQIKKFSDMWPYSNRIQEFPVADAKFWSRNFDPKNLDPGTVVIPFQGEDSRLIHPGSSDTTE